MTSMTASHAVPPAEAAYRSPRTSPWRRFFDVVAQARSYRRIGFLLAGLPLGTAWFTALVAAVSTSVTMLVVGLVGIPMLWVTWLAVRAFANVERHATSVLLDRHLPAAPIEAGTGNVWARLRSFSRDRDRWNELAYLLLRFPAGIATFTIAVTVLATPVLLATAPLHARLDDHPFGDWAHSGDMERAATSPWAWLLVPLGVVLVFAAFHLLNRLAEWCGAWASAWLTPRG